MNVYTIKNVKRHPLNNRFNTMKTRCYNPKAINYGLYGERGIRVCDRWIGVGGFARFLADMGNPPTPEYQLDRIDTNGNYEPNNCRWVTRIENMRNKRKRKDATFTLRDAIEVHKLYKAGMTQKNIGEIYGVAQGQIANIIIGHRWPQALIAVTREEA